MPPHPPHPLLAGLLGCGLLLAGLLAGGPAMARQYAVEIIVFERPADTDERGDEQGDEQWDFAAERTAERLREMSRLAGQASAHTASEEVIHLQSVRAGLLESGYRILDTTRWRQSSGLYRNAPLIPLGNPDTPLAAGFLRVYTVSQNSPIIADLNLQLSPPLPDSPTESPPTPLPDSSSDPADSVLTGAAPVADAHAVAGETADTQAESPPHYFITEKRQLKFKQLHYFDHPYFGAILGVWRARE